MLSCLMACGRHKVEVDAAMADTDGASALYGQIRAVTLLWQACQWRNQCVVVCVSCLFSTMHLWSGPQAHANGYKLSGTHCGFEGRACSGTTSSASIGLLLFMMQSLAMHIQMAHAGSAKHLEVALMCRLYRHCGT